MNVKLYPSFGALIIFLISPLLSFPHLSVYAAVVINEVLPKTSDVSLEWIELYNNGSETVSLDRWKLENTSGEKKTFGMNASAIIQPHGFLTFYQPQTGINFNLGGDTVILSDQNNSQVDSQQYSGTLGYNNSMGRNIDGGGAWTICTTATPNQANNCPAPSPSPTPLPTEIPTQTPIPTPTIQTPIEVPTLIISTPIPTLPAVLVVTNASPTPTSSAVIQDQSQKLQSFGWILLIVGIIWGIIMTIVVIHHRKQGIPHAS